MRQTLLSLHRWAGVGIGAFVFIIAVTGALLVFEREIDGLLNGHLLAVTPGGRHQSLQPVLANVHATFPGEAVARIALPQEPDQALLV